MGWGFESGVKTVDRGFSFWNKIVYFELCSMARVLDGVHGSVTRFFGGKKGWICYTNGFWPGNKGRGSGRCGCGMWTYQGCFLGHA